MADAATGLSLAEGQKLLTTGLDSWIRVEEARSKKPSGSVGSDQPIRPAGNPSDARQPGGQALGATSMSRVLMVVGIALVAAVLVWFVAKNAAWAVIVGALAAILASFLLPR